jgi:hypothetical protein
MGHFAKVLDGKVIQVIVAEPDFFNTFIDTSAGTWLQTSYNTYGNLHKLGGTPLRGNFAGVGFTYDQANDVFYAPQPFPSWSLNQSTWLWEAPISLPTTNGRYKWDEPSLSWIEIE